jgi:hypothetical protein
MAKKSTTQPITIYFTMPELYLVKPVEAVSMTHLVQAQQRKSSQARTAGKHKQGYRKPSTAFLERFVRRERNSPGMPSLVALRALIDSPDGDDIDDLISQEPALPIADIDQNDIGIIFTFSGGGTGREKSETLTYRTVSTHLSRINARLVKHPR